MNDDIRDLESKIEERRKGNEEMAKTVKKTERKLKEAILVMEEDRKFLVKTQEDYESSKIKSRKLKNQIEEIDSQIMMFSESLKLAALRTARICGKSLPYHAKDAVQIVLSHLLAGCFATMV